MRHPFTIQGYLQDERGASQTQGFSLNSCVMYSMKQRTLAGINRPRPQGVRAELAQQGTLVVGAFPGPVDTAMAEAVPLDKAAPIEVAKTVLQAVEQRIEEVYPDPVSQSVFANLQTPLKEAEKQFAGMPP